jgi:hypothetical protein
MCALVALPAFGAELHVTTAADDGSAGTLRWAIEQANGNAEADLIVFDADFTVHLAAQLPTVTTEMTIAGNGWDRTIIDGGAADTPPGVQAFTVGVGGSLTLDGVMVQNCRVTAVGVQEAGSFWFKNSRCERTAPGGYGGVAISSRGDTRLVNSVVRFNSATGIFAFGGVLELERSAVVENGWGIQAWSSYQPASVTVSNSTISGNDYTGMQLFQRFSNPLAVDIQYSTIANNQWGICLLGEGVGPTTSVTGSIIVGNRFQNCDGRWEAIDGLPAMHITGGYNLEDRNECPFEGTANQHDEDPRLGPLVHDASTTYVHPLLFGSPAIDQGDPGSNLTTDQRGSSRPLDGDGDTVAVCDIGAFEYAYDPTDSDEDGVSASEEDGAPNDGDGNHDGMLDSSQSEVASFISQSGEYVTIAPSDGVLSDVQSLEPPAELPPGFEDYHFPHGLLHFTVTDFSGPGTSVVLFLPPDPLIDSYLKFDPTLPHEPESWYPFTYSEGQPAVGAIVDQDDIDDPVWPRTTVELFFEDGNGFGDHDFLINLEIHDPGSPVYSAATVVEVDVKPGSHVNPINLESGGRIPVAVLTTPDFDAANVDPATVLFTGAQPIRWMIEDVDGDGDLDALFHFKTQALDLDGNSTYAVLIGQTTDGSVIWGSDFVTIVP